MEALDASSSAASSSASSSDSSSAAASPPWTPWLDVLEGSRVVFQPPPDVDQPTDYRLVAALHLDLQRLLANAADALTTMARVRQAMELLRMAFLADADTLAQLERQGWIDGMDGDVPTHDELHFPSRDLRFVLRYTASPRQDASVHHAIAAHLLTARPLCAGELFQAAYEELHDACTRSHQVTRRAKPIQVELETTVAGVTEAGATDEEVERVVWSIGILAARARSFKPSSQIWSIAYSHIQVTGIRLRVQDIMLTRRIVFAFQETMQANADMIQCLDCTVDSRRIACSEAELGDYLTALTESSPAASVQVGHVDVNSPFLVIDLNHEDFTDEIRVVLRAVGSCNTVRAINIAPLATLLLCTRNRACFWMSALEFVLCSRTTNTPPLKSLELRGYGGLREEDLQHLRRGRVTVGRVRREVHALTIDLTGIINSDVLELIHWVGQVRSLSVRQRATSIGPRMLEAIWEGCSNIESIALERICVADMAIFNEAFARMRSLTSLVIKNMSLINVSTADTFIREIGEPSSLVASQLRHLQIERGSIEPRSIRPGRPLTQLFEFSASQVHLLARSLERNTQLRCVKIAAQRDIPRSDRLGLLQYGRRNIPRSTKSEGHKQRILAFLSVIAAAEPSDAWGRMDAWTLRLVFTFSAPFDRRRVVLVD